MRDAQELRQRLADYLRGKGLEAVTAWPQEGRGPAGKAVAAVSLRGMESGPPGFQDYLGERYDEGTGRWEELYGKRVELTFGLDLYAATAQGAQEGLDALGAALAEEGPQGLRPVAFSAGETGYDSGSRRYVCPVQARFLAWYTAVAAEDGVFRDFEVRGENRG